MLPSKVGNSLRIIMTLMIFVLRKSTSIMTKQGKKLRNQSLRRIKNPKMMIKCLLKNLLTWLKRLPIYVGRELMLLLMLLINKMFLQSQNLNPPHPEKASLLMKMMISISSQEILSWAFLTQNQLSKHGFSLVWPSVSLMIKLLFRL